MSQSNLECGDLSPLSESRMVVVYGKAPMSRRTPKRMAVFSVSLWLMFVVGCATSPHPTHDRAAKALFENTARNYHFPSDLATGAERDRLLREAATGYARVLQQYPDQESWCAKALRSFFA